MKNDNQISYSELSLLLTSQRSSEQLNQTFKFAIKELLGKQEFLFFVNSGTNHSHSFFLLDADVQSVEHDAILTRINNLDFSVWQSISDEIEEHRLYYPALLDERLFACIVINGELTDEKDRELFSLLAVYANTQAMINDSAFDGLTGLYNRKNFDNELSVELAKHFVDSRRKADSTVSQEKSYLAFLDIDHFKLVNDTHGHLAGDEVLLKLANIMRKSFREIDGLFRYGGEEFAIIIRDISEKDIELVLTRFNQTIRTADFPIVKNITASIGYFLLSDKTTSAEAIDNVDKALYYAKENGRDQIANFDELLKNNKITVTDIDSDIELF